MRAPETPIDDAYRVMALEALNILDTPPEPSFEALVELGRSLFAVPTCLVSLVDRERQWFKARIGLDAAETPRDISFCGHAILDRQVLVVPDARDDERFADNPLVAGPPHIRFYAGAPIRLPTGYTIGTVCLLAPEPRHDFDVAAQERLASLAALVVDVLAVRALRAELDRERALVERQAALLEFAGEPLALLSASGEIEACNTAFIGLLGGHADVGVDLDAALRAAGSPGGLPRDPATGRPAEGTLSLPGKPIVLLLERDAAGYLVRPQTD